VKHLSTLLAAGIAVALSGCQADANQAAPAAAPVAAQPTPADADAFVAEFNAQARAMAPEMSAAQWISSTYINPDSQLVAAKANERYLTWLKDKIEQAKKFQGLELKPETGRALTLLKLQTSMPAPSDPKKLAELTALSTKLEGAYGAGKYCKTVDGKESCRDLPQLEDVLKSPTSTYDEQLDAWAGWHKVGAPMRPDYLRFAELMNEGAKELGYGNTGEMWRSGYDMPPDRFAAEGDRLWAQVKPLYDDLQCYVRGKLEAKYGAKGSIDGMIPAHLTGNMWAQSWGEIFDIAQPYKDVSSLDVEAGMKAKGYDPLQMVKRAEDFYVSLGMPQLPVTFWERSMFTQPRDRDVVCHASAWPMDLTKPDVRIKMCIKVDEDSLTTIYHELGHVYYYLAYKDLPPIFQSGAHDGFHEAIGDTIVLAMTPGYLNSIGLVGAATPSKEALINEQLKLAMDRVAVLPWTLLVDRWRWGVFDGSIAPERMNAAWWELRRKYQGVAPAIARTESDFDPGAKYHIPGNTPYTRYFLAAIMQFQFYKALCDASGHTGPLHECTFYGNKEAGKRYWAMLAKGQSQPWPVALKELTGKEEMDATPIIEYFAPLHAWLKEQNAGKQCGWKA
jgi:peptidyl-dipeptidase A